MLVLKILLILIVVFLFVYIVFLTKYHAEQPRQPVSNDKYFLIADDSEHAQMDGTSLPNIPIVRI